MLIVLALVISAAGCGGGGSSSRAPVAPPPPPPPPSSDFDQGIFRSSAIYKDQCLNPRSGVGGAGGAGFSDIQGSTEDENNWLRAWSNELYLWYDEIADADPELFDTPDYFDLMKTLDVTPSGADKDQFHFTFDTEQWLLLSQSGIAVSYGAEFELLSSSIPRVIVVAFVEPGSPATAMGVDLARGAMVLAVDGVDIDSTIQADVEVLNAGLFPSTAGETHNFTVQDVGAVTTRVITMTAAEIPQDPVPTTSIVSTPTGPVGYMLFNSHIATAEGRLITEMAAFEAAGITDLVLDLRYNGGGFLDIANQLAFMIAGPSAASGRVFDETQFNDKNPSINPVTGQALTPDTFHTVSLGIDPTVAPGSPLPSVNLSRVFVLSGPGTCSASEAVINGLRGLDAIQGNMEVILIGDTTCGKPYGFYPQDNCGTTYFSIQFRGINAAGFGDYADGFVPVSTPVEANEVTGCSVIDDFNNPLGDVAEARFDAALSYIANGVCPPAPVVIAASTSVKSLSLNGSSSATLRNPRRIPGTIRRL